MCPLGQHHGGSSRWLSITIFNATAAWILASNQPLEYKVPLVQLEDRLRSEAHSREHCAAREFSQGAYFARVAILSRADARGCQHTDKGTSRRRNNTEQKCIPQHASRQIF